MTGLVIALVIAALAAVGILALRSKLNKLTRTYLGGNLSRTAKMLAEGLRDEEFKAYPVPHKDALYEPKIHRDFPEMTLEKLSAVASNGMIDILNAIESENRSAVKDGSATLENKLKIIIEDNQSANAKVFYDNVKIHACAVDSYKSDENTASAIFLISLQSKYYVMNGEKLVAGSKEKLTQNLFSLTLSHNQNPADAGKEIYIEANCPNCGAPVPLTENNRICKFCGTRVVPYVDKIWQIDDFKLMR